jgi:hypothetical protein
MSKNSKRPRLQTTLASDIAPRHQFTHSSNTSTRTKQILTAATLDESEQINTTSPLIQMDSDSAWSNDLPNAGEAELPAGIEVVTKASRYVNSVWILLVQSLITIYRKLSQDTPLLTWKKYRGDYLDACLILEGRGRFYTSCANSNCVREQGSTLTPSF